MTCDVREFERRYPHCAVLDARGRADEECCVTRGEILALVEDHLYCIALVDDSVTLVDRRNPCTDTGRLIFSLICDIDDPRLFEKIALMVFASPAPQGRS